MVVQEFNAGMSRVYGKKLFTWTTNYLLTREGAAQLTEEQIGRLTGISQSTVSRWKTKGTISIESLVTVLTTLKLDVCDLPPLPSFQVRMVEGYRAAMSWIRREELTTQDFIAFLSLWSEPEWRAYVTSKNADELTAEETRALLGGLAPSVARKIGKYLSREIREVNVEYLEKLEVEWRKPWEECQKAIGYKWQVG